MIHPYGLLRGWAESVSGAAVDMTVLGWGPRLCVVSGLCVTGQGGTPPRRGCGEQMVSRWSRLFYANASLDVVLDILAPPDHSSRYGHTRGGSTAWYGADVPNGAPLPSELGAVPETWALL